MSTVKFGADEYELKASWGASKEFNSLIGDPLSLVMKMNSGELSMSTDDVVRAIWIGLKHAGNTLSFDEVGELCQKYGIINYNAIAAGYLISLVTGDEEVESEGEKKPE